MMQIEIIFLGQKTGERTQHSKKPAKITWFNKHTGDYWLDTNDVKKEEELIIDPHMMRCQIMLQQFQITD